VLTSMGLMRLAASAQIAGGFFSWLFFGLYSDFSSARVKLWQSLTVGYPTLSQRRTEAKGTVLKVRACED
jgi:hypothetical protein